MAVDIVPEKVELINNKKSPIQDEYIEKYLAEKELDLTATLDAKEAYSDADFWRQEDRQAAGLRAGSGWPAQVRRAQVPAGRQLLHRGAPLGHRAEAQDLYLGQCGE